MLNLSAPSEPFEAATKDYVDKMGNYVGKYVDEKNAYFKREVDDFTKLLDYVKKTIDERPHIIAVHMHYHGPLCKDEYQFTFGGESAIDPNGSTGFLIPQSGRMKKIRVKIMIKVFDIRYLPTRGPIFTIITIKDMGEVSDLLTYECKADDDYLYVSLIH